MQSPVQDIQMDYAYPLQQNSSNFYQLQYEKQMYYQQEYEQNFQQHGNQQFFQQDSQQSSQSFPGFYQDSEYCKPSYHMVVQQPPPCPLAPEAPSEGALCPVNFQHSAEMIQHEEQYQNSGNNNNNNNNNNEYVPQNVYHEKPYSQPASVGWFQMDPVDFELTPVVDEKKLKKKEQNKKYSAKCLKNKKDAKKSLEKQSTRMILSHEELKAKNEKEESMLRYAAHSVLLPILGDNNRHVQFDLGIGEVQHQLQQYEEHKMNIEAAGKERKLLSDEFLEKELASQRADEALKTAEYNLQHKDTMASKLKVKCATLGSRRTRAKDAQKCAHYDYQVIWYKMEMDIQREISSLLKWNLDFIRPYVHKMLHTCFQDLCTDFEDMKLPLKEAEALRFFLYRDSG